MTPTDIAQAISCMDKASAMIERLSAQNVAKGRALLAIALAPVTPETAPLIKLAADILLAHHGYDLQAKENQ